MTSEDADMRDPPVFVRDETATLLQRMNAICEEVRYIQKSDVNDDRAPFSKAIGAYDLAESIGQAMTKYGVLLLPVGVEILHLEPVHKETRSGPNVMLACVVLNKMEWVNVDDPGDVKPIEIMTESKQWSDKGPGFSSTYAQKIAMLRTFHLAAVNEDPDFEHGKETALGAEGTWTPPAPQPSSNQREVTAADNSDGKTKAVKLAQTLFPDETVERIVGRLHALAGPTADKRPLTGEEWDKVCEGLHRQHKEMMANA
jgi:hypothetical protein